jgi:hypothetical protein
VNPLLFYALVILDLFLNEVSETSENRSTYYDIMTAARIAN